MITFPDDPDAEDNIAIGGVVDGEDKLLSGDGVVFE